MIGNIDYCNKYGHDWTVWQAFGDKKDTIIYECRICGARQAKWCNTWKKRAGLFSVPCYNASPALERLE